jgi:hypothetical protein
VKSAAAAPVSGGAKPEPIPRPYRPDLRRAFDDGAANFITRVMPRLCQGEARATNAAATRWEALAAPRHPLFDLGGLVAAAQFIG